MNTDGHHLILGKLTDFLTGRRIKDTHDERYRQKIARLLVEDNGFAKEEIQSKVPLEFKAGSKKAVLYVDFVVFLDSVPCMVIVYGPGSIVTRERPALAASRLITDHYIKTVVVTNGEDAVILDGLTGAPSARGLNTIPSRADLSAMVHQSGDLPGISAKKAEMEARILYAFEIDGRCPCDDDVCIL